MIDLIGVDRVAFVAPGALNPVGGAAAETEETAERGTFIDGGDEGSDVPFVFPIIIGDDICSVLCMVLEIVECIDLCNALKGFT